MSKAIYLTDRSRIVTREECERKRYLNYDFDVDGEMVGIQRRETSLPQLNGVEIHEAHARILAHHAGLSGGFPIDRVVQVQRDSFIEHVDKFGVYGDFDPKALVLEQTALLEGMLRTFERLWLPRILEEYDVVTIEQPMDYHLAPGLVLKLRFDTMLRRKGDGQLVILDYKSMGYISSAWTRKLERSRQTSLYIKAAQELYGESVEIAYLGMVKGARRTDTAKSSPFFGQKIQSSPYLYAYVLEGNVGNVYQTDWTNKKGYRKIRTYEQMPMKEWIDWMWANERNTLNELFTFNPPFAPTPREMERVKELVVREELAYVRRIEHYRELKAKALRDNNSVLLQKAEEYLDYIAAPMREERCYQYGEEYACPFLGVCFNEGGLETVLEDGEFIPRIAHHSTELEEAA